MEDSGEAVSFVELEPLLMIPPPQSDWVIKKVAEVKRRLGYSFDGMKQRIRDFFGKLKGLGVGARRVGRAATKDPMVGEGLVS